MRQIAVLTVAAALFAAAPAHAQVQTKGPEVFPGKIQLGVQPLGVQIGFGNRSPGGYKAFFDISGLIASPGKLSLWLGGGVNFTYGFYGCYVRDCGYDLQVWVFIMLTFEKLIPIPLVPFVRAGLGADVLFYNAIAGAAVMRVGGGAYYWLLRWLGVGMETNFTVGPGFYPNGAGTLFYGNWDVGLGVRFAF
jgi:hypothetical protein